MESTRTHNFLAAFPEGLSHYKTGQPVILVDDEDRENEGDITIATEHLTEEWLLMMVREARGLACVSVPREHGFQLGLRAQVGANQSRFSTPFSATVDHRSVAGKGQGVRARVATMRALAKAHATADEFVSPGNCFPLLAHPTGVFGRIGQTEGGYDLSRLCGFFPSAVICEVLNPDGTMARGDALVRFADRFKMPIISVRQIIEYRTEHDPRVVFLEERVLTTAWGSATVKTFRDEATGREHFAMVFGEHSQKAAPVVRIHSECLTGDVFGSQRCDCGPQLHAAASMMAAAASKGGSGVLVYLRQEGRGIGLANKLRAYELQDRGADTVEANTQLGLPIDSRSYAVAARMLEALGVHTAALITNNPSKIEQLRQHGVVISERIPSRSAELGPLAQSYIQTKQQRLGHFSF